MSLTSRLMTACSLALLCAIAAPAGADPVEPPNHAGGQGPHGMAAHQPPGGYRFDSRFSHNQYYPQQGHAVPALPHGYTVVHHPSGDYFYCGGVWYRPHGPSYWVVAPPIGLGIAFLPGFYTTLWFGSVPYYYANDVYYQTAPGGGYVVAAPPEGTPDRVEQQGNPPPPPTSSTDFFFYPRNGQSPEQQSEDRYQCHLWAVSQSGVDPSKDSSIPEGKRTDYQRATQACLEGRGYTVR